MSSSMRSASIRSSELVGVGGKTRGEQIGLALSALEHAFLDDRPDAVVVQGDTNSTVAAALAANAREIPLVHVEAGLRSFDRRMPEEHNRVITDHLADLCLAPTLTASENLISEGIPEDRLIVTGNTIVEAVNTSCQHRERPQRDSQPPSPVRRRAMSCRPSIDRRTWTIRRRLPGSSKNSADCPFRSCSLCILDQSPVEPIWDPALRANPHHRADRIHRFPWSSGRMRYRGLRFRRASGRGLDRQTPDSRCAKIHRATGSDRNFRQARLNRPIDGGRSR